MECLPTHCPDRNLAGVCSPVVRCRPVPEHPTVFYHLAVYDCRLHKVREAWTWLEHAFEIGDAVQIKLKAPDYPDLEPLRAEIREV